MSAAGRQVVTDNATLRERYASLKVGDLVATRVRAGQREEYLLVDLLERGIELFPSALAQLASRSKAMQVLLFAPYMLPGTRAVHDLHELLAVMPNLARGRVVSKLDRRNGGLGVFLWNSVEEVYSQAALGLLPFPFVLQPFVPEARDMRVIVLGDYLEAYWRQNSGNFRHNLHCGGRSVACEPSDSQSQLCRAVMARGKFPYAHLDLLVTPEGDSYLGEINLRGGIRGAKISAPEYGARLAALQAAACNPGESL